MEVDTNKNGESRQSPHQNRNIKSSEYIFSDENGNLCDGVRIHPEFEKLIHTLSSEELTELETSIKAKGCLDPIKVWKGYIIDGHHRHLICEKHTIPYEVLEIDFEDEWEVKKWMIDNQLGRRNLTDASRIEYASLRVDIIRGVAQRNQEMSRFGKKEELSLEGLPARTKRSLERRSEKQSVIVNAAIGKMAGVSKSTVARYNYVKQHADDETLKNLREGNLVPFGSKNKKKKLSVDGLYRELKKQERKNNAQSRVSKSTHRKDNLINTGSDVEEQNQGACPIGDVIEEVEFVIKKECSKKLFNRIITHPIDELHRFVDPGSVDVIITEPPCKEEDIDLFDELGDFARHALKDGGVCITICENRHLIDFMEMLRAHLDYVWLVSLDADAVKYGAPNGHINKLWKPVLVFSKGIPQMKTFSDVKNSIENIVQSFSDRGDVICDPFCNEGEIAKICVENSRSIVASDMDVAKTDTLKDVFL